MTHRPPTEMLARYATGSVSPGLALLISTHLDTAADSRSIVADLDAAAGALFGGEPPAPLAPDALDRVLARLNTPAQEPRHPDPGPLPQSLADRIGIDFDRIPWRFRLPGLSEYQLEGFGPESVSLLRARPGAGIPQHTHQGEEATLVLTGAMQDGDAVYRAGDVALAGEDDDHRPRIIGDEVCHCLVVMSGPLRFTGVLSRALNYLGE